MNEVYSDVYIIGYELNGKFLHYIDDYWFDLESAERGCRAWNADEGDGTYKVLKYGRPKTINC